MEDELKLPPVAKSIFYFCKKCDAERYHTVLAHPTSISAKIECEVCKSKKTYKITEPKKGRKKTATRKKRVTAEEAHKKEFDEIRVRVGIDDVQKYNMKEKFDSDSAIDHPKFGVGFITAALPDKIEVCFEDSQRILVHNRG